MGYVIALGQFLLHLLQLSPVGIIPLILYIHIPFINDHSNKVSQRSVIK